MSAATAATGHHAVDRDSQVRQRGAPSLSQASTVIGDDEASSARDGAIGAADAARSDTTFSKHSKPKSKYRHVAAVHSKARPSCLSHDATASPSFIGFRNLMVIFLVVGNLRLMIENIQKYGVLICIHCHNFRSQDIFYGALLLLVIPVFLLVAYLIELWASVAAKLSVRESSSGDGSSSPTEAESERFRKTWKLVGLAHLVSISLLVTATSFIVYYDIHHPLIGTLTETHAIVVGLKIVSYAFTNRDLRHAYLHPARGEREALPDIYASCPYPNNITLSNLAYFWWAPTLVYQPVYPRTPSIRWVFVLKRLAEVLGLTAFIWFCSAQYATPTLMNSLDKIRSLNIPAIIERLLKLSTISLVIWLAGFFALFQSYLNALAELMRFGDRSFYDEWWNSNSVKRYWTTWNKPVSQYFRRHVYEPLIGRGWSKTSAGLSVFFVSAVLHELLVGIPTHNITFVAFWAMMFQVVLVKLTQPFERMEQSWAKVVGNTIFWVSFTVLGQPAAALWYFYAWQGKFGSVSRSISAGAHQSETFKARMAA